MSEYFIPSGIPATGTFGQSILLRTEFVAIQAAFTTKFPVLAGNAYKLTFINATGTGMTVAGSLLTNAAGNLGIGKSPTTMLDVNGTTTSTLFVGPLTGNVTGNVTGSSGSTTGNAATATALATARLIGGTSFDGSANITPSLASTATALATARTIGGTSFDGTANVAVALATAATTAGTVTTAAQPAITSVGTLSGLNVAGPVTLAGAVTGITDLTTTGNTVLGDATTDTLNVGAGGLVKDASGNVGIGTAAPATKLHVVGATTLAGQVVISPGNYVGIGRTSNLAVKLDVDGALALSATTSTSASTFAVQPDHNAIRCAATCQLSLPFPVSCPGRLITICNVGAFAVTNFNSDVLPLGSATAGTAILAATSGKFAQLQSNGTNWVTLMAN